jgi:hypothetical protein
MVSEYPKKGDCSGNISGVPKRMPIPGFFRFTIVEVYRDLKSKTPLEYIPLFADAHIHYPPKNARDPAAAWRLVAKKFF